MTEGRLRRRVTLYRLLTAPRLRTGSRLHTVRAYLISLLYEWRRIVAWHGRFERDHVHEMMPRGWFQAWRATVENPPSLDRAWDDLDWTDDGDPGDAAQLQGEQQQ